MVHMKKEFIRTILVTVCLFVASDRTFGQEAGQYGVFKVSATVPVTRIVETVTGRKMVTKTLTTNDIINLAQGRPLGTKFDPKREVLAANATFEDEGGPTPRSQLVIYDPSVGGAEGIKLVVGSLTEIK